MKPRVPTPSPVSSPKHNFTRNEPQTLSNPTHPADTRQAALSMLAHLSELIASYSTTNAHQPGTAAWIQRAQKLRSKLASTVLNSSRKPRNLPVS